MNGSCGLPEESERTVVVDQSDPNRGRFDPVRFANPKPYDDEDLGSPVTPEDLEATRAELDELRRKMTRKSA